MGLREGDVLVESGLEVDGAAGGSCEQGSWNGVIGETVRAEVGQGNDLVVEHPGVDVGEGRPRKEPDKEERERAVW